MQSELPHGGSVATWRGVCSQCGHMEGCVQSVWPHGGVCVVSVATWRGVCSQSVWPHGGGDNLLQTLL